MLAGGRHPVAEPLQAQLSVDSAEGSEERNFTALSSQGSSKSTDKRGWKASRRQRTPGGNCWLLGPDGTELTGRT